MIGANLNENWTISALLSDMGENSLLWRAENGRGDAAAIKIPRDIEDPIRNEKRQKRFKNEISTLLLLRRKGITSVMPVLEHGFIEERKPWYAMPIGTSIALTPSFVSRLELLSQLTVTVEKMHSIGIEHLDIKLGNLLIIDGKLILSDFGHSKYTGISHLETHPLDADKSDSGTAARTIDPDRPWFDYDMYSLGKACWEILTGLKSKSLRELQSPEDNLQPHWPGIDSTVINKLEVLIFSAASKIPQDRPNAMQFNQGIQELLSLAKKAND